MKTYSEFDKGFREGIRFGINLFAWWKNGVTYIGRQRTDGTGERPAAEAIRIALEEHDRTLLHDAKAKVVWR